MGVKLISVIVPIYNVESYLEKCINSIVNQTYTNLEIILIDDGSTDNSGIICDKYKKQDKRIIVIHQNNKGLSSARNKGLDIAKGELITFVDGDDYIELTMIEELNNNMNKYNSDIAMCDFNYCKNDNIINNKYEGKKESCVTDDKEKYCIIQNELGSIIVYAWNKLYKKEIFDGIRYPEGKIYEDSFVLCDVLNKAKSISYLLKPLYNYVYRSDSIVNTFTINHFDKINSFNRKIEFFNNKEYFDLALEEKNRKMNILIVNLSKMKRYGIKNKEVWNKYYKELLNTNKEVKWKGSTKYNKFYKVFKKPSISAIAYMSIFKDFVRKFTIF